MDTIRLDGNYLEGGGQIIRTALALSAYTGKSFEISQIRKGRPNPGLQPQHLAAVQAVKEYCGAEVSGCVIGSEYIKFSPHAVSPQTLSIDIGTAGSVTLLLQSLMIPAIFAPEKSRFKITGGTDVAWSMPADYFESVFLFSIKNLADIEYELIRRGYYPKGNGKIELKIMPRFSAGDVPDKITAIEKGNLVQIEGISHASLDLQKKEVAERQAKSAKHALSHLECPMHIKTEYRETLSTGSGITLFAVYEHGRLGADAIGERNKTAETVGEEASGNLAREMVSQAPVDSHLADQLIPFLAIAKGKIACTTISNHAKTNIYVVSKFLDTSFVVDDVHNTIEAK